MSSRDNQEGSIDNCKLFPSKSNLLMKSRRLSSNHDSIRILSIALILKTARPLSYFLNTSIATMLSTKRFGNTHVVIVYEMRCKCAQRDDTMWSELSSEKTTRGVRADLSLTHFLRHSNCKGDQNSTRSLPSKR